VERKGRGKRGKKETDGQRERKELRRKEKVELKKCFPIFCVWSLVL
jgi:hypothetical protein